MEDRKQYDFLALLQKYREAPDEDEAKFISSLLRALLGLPQKNKSLTLLSKEEELELFIRVGMRAYPGAREMLTPLLADAIGAAAAQRAAARNMPSGGLAELFEKAPVIFTYYLPWLQEIIFLVNKNLSREHRLALEETKKKLAFFRKTEAMPLTMRRGNMSPAAIAADKEYIVLLLKQICREAGAPEEMLIDEAFWRWRKSKKIE